jgi:hypothetical protein
VTTATAVIGENFLYVFERRVAGARHKGRSWMLQWLCPEEGDADCVKQPPACSWLHVSIRPVPPRIGRWTVIVVARGSRPEGRTGVNGLSLGSLRLLGRLPPPGQRPAVGSTRLPLPHSRSHVDLQL